MSYVKIPKENYDKVLEVLESMRKEAAEARAEIRQTLREAEKESERRQKVFRRAGLLRD
jgi:prephenate dehydrogenase